MSECKKRSISIDSIRGAGILFVVLGHIIQILNPNNFDDLFLFRVIYSFHMPLFMVISGLSMNVSRMAAKNANIGIWKRAVRLLLPFLIWTLIHSLLKGNRTLKSVIGYFLMVILRPDMELWFLWILFLNTVLIGIILKLSSLFKDKYYSLIETFIILIFEVILEIYFCKVPGINLCRWHFKFFALGFLFAKYKTCLQPYFKKIFLGTIAFFIILIPYWSRTEVPKVPFFSGIFMQTSLVLLSYNILVAICGSYTVAYVIWCIPDNLKIKRSLAFLGQHTIEIYILSNYFIRDFFEEKMINYLVCFFLAIGGSVIIKKALEFVPYANLFLFGDNNKKIKNYDG